MTVTIDDDSPDQPVIVMTHMLDAPREVVWTAFTDPKHVARWYGGKGFANPVCEMDVRPGGHWRHVMRTPDGAEHSLLFVFIDVVRPEKLSWQPLAHGPHGPSAARSTLTLADHGRQTKVTFVARFSSVAERKMAKGWGFAKVLREGVDRMAEVLKEVTVTFSAYAMRVETFVPMLRTLSSLLDKGAAHASARKFDSAVLVNARLAPDMYSLVKQVQIACDHAKNGTARLVGQEPPRFADDEQTLDQLKERIAKTIDYVQSVAAGAFEGAEGREIEIPMSGDMVFAMNGAQFLRDWALPHFYFHVVTAYDILRHNGVELGKPDYLSHVGSYIRRRGEPPGAQRTPQ
jgi:hypothetical protein